jgi:hypothetical protein
MESRRLTALDRIVVTVESPDSSLRVVMHGRNSVEVTFAPGAHRFADARTLGQRLGQLGTATFTAYRRAYLAAISEEIGGPLRDGGVSPDPKVRRYREETSELRLAATSPNGWIRATSIGLARWDFSLHPSTCEQLSEAQFVSELRSVVRAVLADFDRQALAVLSEIRQSPPMARR